MRGEKIVQARIEKLKKVEKSFLDEGNIDYAQAVKLAYQELEWVLGKEPQEKRGKTIWD